MHIESVSVSACVGTTKLVTTKVVLGGAGLGLTLVKYCSTLSHAYYAKALSDSSLAT